MMRVIVVGGGASGCMASLLIARKGHAVTLLEKNEKLGKKLYITGKGRCNLTNATTGNEFLKNVVSNAKFFMSSEVRFNSADTMELFKSLNVPLKIERGNRVFPASDKASDITRAMEQELKRLKVDIRLGTEVAEVLAKDGAASGVRLKDGSELDADAVVVATGGITYPLTGSTGDGYKFARELGHRIVEPVGGLNSLCVSDPDLNALSGLTLKNVCLLAREKGKLVYKTDIGEMLLTHTGISGPLVLEMSSHINRILPQNVKMSIDFKPALTDFALFQRIERDIVALKSKQFSSLLNGLLPESLAAVFAKRLGIARTKKVNQLTSQERRDLVYMLKGFTLNYTGQESVDRAVITSGGVCVKDLKPKNMESKLVSRLYFIGEVIDVDAHTGGFNLQIAFSTAASCASDF